MAVRHVGDCLAAGVNAFRSDRRAVFDGKAFVIDRDLIACFERVAAYAGKTFEFFVQFEIVTDFFVAFRDITDNKVFLSINYGEFRSGYGVFFTARNIRVFADSDIVTCFDRGL